MHIEAVVCVRLHLKPSELKPVYQPVQSWSMWPSNPPKLVATPCTQKTGGFGQLPLHLGQGSPGTKAKNNNRKRFKLHDFLSMMKSYTIPFHPTMTLNPHFLQHICVTCSACLCNVSCQGPGHTNTLLMYKRPLMSATAGLVILASLFHILPLITANVLLCLIHLLNCKHACIFVERKTYHR